MVSNTVDNTKAEVSATIKPFTPENAGMTKINVGPLMLGRTEEA